MRLSGCALDCQLLSLLRQALTAEATVHTLHVDYNRLELPLMEAATQKLSEARHGSEIDLVEKELEQRRAQRQLQSFRDELVLQGQGEGRGFSYIT